ncbi:MAG: hypothetical protein IPP77_00155 [Bacteroidetes bacterium]|nr:hypothetical protein [Bacteroidota bacterium]
MGPYTYSWNPSTNLSATDISNPEACALLASATYTVMVTDINLCTATDAVNLLVVPSSLTAEAGVTDTICRFAGASVRLGGIPTAMGGFLPYSYTWSPDSTLDLSDPANPLAYPSQTTTYHLTVTDAKGCQTIDSVTLYVFPSPVADAGTDTSSLCGTGIALGGANVASGGTGAYSYTWSPSIGLSNAFVERPTATLPTRRAIR